MTQIIEALASWIVDLISHGTYLSIVLLMAIESACIPLPSEIIMPFAGYLASKGVLSLWLAALAGAVGCNLGSTVAYFAGAWGGRRFVDRWGKYLLVSGHDLDVAESFFRRLGAAAVFIGRLLPLVRTFIALPAGFARMPFWTFQLYTFVGSLIWCFALAYLGQILGEQWDKNPAIQTAFHGADVLIALLVLAAIGWFVWTRLHQRSRADRDL